MRKFLLALATLALLTGSVGVFYGATSTPAAACGKHARTCGAY